MPSVKLIVDGGAMKPGPAVAQQLGPMGINLGKLIEDVNKETKNFKGMKVPVTLEVNPKTKEYSISVSSPPVSELIKKEIGIEKASSEPGKIFKGNLAIEQAISVAKTKMSNMLAKDLKAAVKLVVGSCASSGILVENKPATETQKDIDKGIYDKEIAEEKTEMSSEKKEKIDSYFKEVVAEQEAKAKAEEVAKEQEEAAKTESTEEQPKAKEKPSEKPKK